MLGVTRRSVGVAGLALASFALLLSALAPLRAGAEAPPGPRLALLRLGLKPIRLELLSVDAKGALPVRLAGGGRRERPLPLPFASFSWSPDGNLIAFSGLTTRGHSRSSLFVAAADGSGVQRIPGTDGAYYPVFSPDGHTIAFARKRERHRKNRDGDEDLVYESVSVWLADLAGGSPRQLTPWRNRLSQIPSSFSPDGATLAVTRSTGGAATAVALSLVDGASTVLLRNAFEPVYSPDGSRFAFLRGPRRTFETKNGATTATLTDLYSVSSTGGGPVLRLTKTRWAVEVAPSWDPSGERLVYTELRPLESGKSALGLADSIVEINSDGTCRVEVFSDPNAAFFGATWQPGPGREAGRILC